MKKSLLHFTLLCVLAIFCPPSYGIAQERDINKINLLKESREGFAKNGQVQSFLRATTDDEELGWELPFLEDFEDQTGGLGGGMYGWTLSHQGLENKNDYFGSGDVKDAYTGQIIAHSGQNTLYSIYSDEHAIDRIAVTPGLQMYEGVPYYVSVWVYRKGYVSEQFGEVADEFKIFWTDSFAEATAANGDRGTLIIDGSGENAERRAEWREYTAEVIPKEDGIYYFCINVCTSTPGGNTIQFDDFKVEEAPAMLPTAGFNMSANKSIEWGGVVIFEDISENYGAQTIWEFVANNGSYKFNQSAPGGSSVYHAFEVPVPAGNYTITQTVTNPLGTETQKKSLKVSNYAWVGELYDLYEGKSFNNMEDYYAFSGWSPFYVSEWDETFIYTDFDSSLRTKWFYLRPGHEYELWTYMAALSGTSDLTFQMLYFNEENNETELIEELEITESLPANNFKELNLALSVEKTGNYAFVITPKSILLDEDYESVRVAMLYFALFDKDWDGLGVENASREETNVYANDGNIIVKDVQGEVITVYSIDGKQIYTGTNSTIAVENGIYIVKVGNTTTKVMVN